ncbi:MAG: hypothetical protein OEV40_25450 [Acidimicrobiia bacterium]|nr:hypothetical protein [Acidimicrobiia bacterium]
MAAALITARLVVWGLTPRSLAPSETATGLVISDTAQDRPNQRTAFGVRPGIRSEQTGELAPVGINPRDAVVSTGRYADLTKAGIIVHAKVTGKHSKTPHRSSDSPSLPNASSPTKEDV